MVQTRITATPEQAEKQWFALTPRQQDVIRYAKSLKKNLIVTVGSDGPMNLVFDMEVSNEPIQRG